MSTPLTNLSECTLQLQGYTRAMHPPVRMLQDLTEEVGSEHIDWERAHRWCLQMEGVIYLLNQVADALVRAAHQGAGIAVPHRAPSEFTEFDGDEEGAAACIIVLERLAQLFEQSGELLEIADEQLGILWEDDQEGEQADSIDSELELLESVGQLFLNYAEHLSSVLDPELELF